MYGDVMISLKNPYISVDYENGPSFGGSQTQAVNKTIKHVGCGVIAAADLIIYLSRNHVRLNRDFMYGLRINPIEPKNYTNFLRHLRNRYFPIIPHIGMNGLGLMTGMELFFKLYKLPFDCHWCISDKGIWDKIEQMLKADIPVIMAVGPNFPFIWKKGRAMLYSKSENGTYIPSGAVKAHFITITGMNEEWLEISSWGRRLYLNRRMYEEYVSKYSASLVSNILYVKKKPE